MQANSKDWRAERNNEVSELLRRKIVDAASTCLKETSYAQLRMDMIAKEAGCSRGTLYRYFSSKEEILLTIAIENYSRIAERVSMEIADIEDPRLQFATGLAKAMSLSLNDKHLGDLSMDMVNKAITTDPEALKGTIAASLQEYFDKASEQNLLREGCDLESIAQWIIQASNGLLNTGWPSVAGKTLNDQEQVKYLCRYLLYPVFDMQGIAI